MGSTKILAQYMGKNQIFTAFYRPKRLGLPSVRGECMLFHRAGDATEKLHLLGLVK